MPRLVRASQQQDGSPGSSAAARAAREPFLDSFHRLAAALPAASSPLAGRRRPSRGGVAARLTARTGLAALACLALLSFAAQAQTNTPPTASNNTVTTNEDTAYTFAAANFNFADTDGDTDGGTLALVEVVTLPTVGTLALNTTPVTPNQDVAASDIGNLVFTPAANANGTGYASFTFKVSDGTDKSASAYTMTVNVTAVNDAATGLPTISGTVRVGETLTAVTTDIADADGLPASFSHQWVRVDNGIDTDISGATISTYTLVDDDLGKTIKVAVSFTDDGGSSEERTSAETTSVLDVAELPSAPTGLSVAPTLGAGGSLDASWTAPTNTGKPTITGYKLQYSTSSSGPWSNGPQNVTGTSSTFTTGLAENTLYYVRVLAFNSDGDGAWSSTDSATTRIATTITNCPAPTLTGRAQIWSATVSLETGEVNNLVPYIGFNTVTPHDVFGALSDTSFEVGTNSYTVRTLATLPTASDALFLSLDGHVTDTEKAELTLHVCDVAVALSSATVVDAAGFKAYQWVYGVDWSDYATREAYLSVPSVNTAPTASNGTVATATNTAYTFDAGDFNFADADTGDTLEKVKIVTAPDAGTLALDGATVMVNQEVTKADIDGDDLTFTPATDATGSPYTTFTFKVNDGEAESASAYTMTVNVVDNIAPVFAVSTVARSFAENTAANVNIGAVIPEATDADTDAMLTYSMEGTDAASFNFNETTRQISTRPGVTYSFEQNPSYSVTIRVSDGIASDTVAVTISLTDVDEPPSTPAGLGVGATFGSTTSLDVSWTAPRNTGKPDIVRYELQYRIAGVEDWTDAPRVMNATSSTIAGLIGNTLYQVRVSALNVEGESPWSAPRAERTSNTVPTASNSSVTAMQNHAYTFAARDFSFMDADANDTLKNVSVGSLPGGGTLTLSGTAVMPAQVVTRTDIDNGNLKFTPVAGATGSPYATFGFRVNDGEANSALALHHGRERDGGRYTAADSKRTDERHDDGADL